MRCPASLGDGCRHRAGSSWGAAMPAGHGSNGRLSRHFGLRDLGCSHDRLCGHRPLDLRLGRCRLGRTFAPLGRWLGAILWAKSSVAGSWAWLPWSWTPRERAQACARGLAAVRLLGPVLLEVAFCAMSLSLYYRLQFATHTATLSYRRVGANKRGRRPDCRRPRLCALQSVQQSRAPACPPLYGLAAQKLPGTDGTTPHLRVALPSNADASIAFLRLRVPDLFTPAPSQAP